MGLFGKKTPEEIAAEEERQREEQRAYEAAELARKEAEFRETPLGRALTAKESGRRLFQVELTLSSSSAYLNIWLPLKVETHIKDQAHITTLEAIEKFGWRLEQAGYVFRVTGSESRAKMLTTGLQEAVSGEIIGIYIFRATWPEGQTQA